MINPLSKLNQWWQEAKIDSPLNQKNAICVSTINTDGFPSGRFVDLKDVNDKGLIFCSNFDSNKGKEIEQNSKVAITIWWDHLGYQIRVIGRATTIDDTLADKYWSSRNHDAKISTLALKQSQTVDTINNVQDKFNSYRETFDAENIKRPTNWGGYIVEPISIEFLKFKTNRLHIRELYKKTSNGWRKVLLQP